MKSHLLILVSIGCLAGCSGRRVPPPAPVKIEEDPKNHGPLDGHAVKVLQLLEDMDLAPEVMARCREVARTSQMEYREWYRVNKGRVAEHTETIRKLKADGDKQDLKKAQAEKKVFMHTAPSLLRKPEPLEGVLPKEDHAVFLKRLEALKASLHQPRNKKT